MSSNNSMFPYNILTNIVYNYIRYNTLSFGCAPLKENIYIFFKEK